MPTPELIAICDDHPIVREGFRQLIEADGRHKVAREFGSVHEVLGPDALAGMRALVLDLSLPDGNGLDLLDRLGARYPDLAVVVLSMHDAPAYARDALLRGARGFVSKRAAADELPEALAAAIARRRYVSRDLRDRLDAAPGGTLPSVTAREHEVFVRLARGEAVQQIADALHISIKTVYAHRTSLMQKLGVDSEVGLNRIARERGLAE